MASVLVGGSADVSRNGGDGRAHWLAKSWQSGGDAPIPASTRRPITTEETTMLLRPARPLAAALALLFVPLVAGADAGVRVRFDRHDPAATPFPNDRFTVRDFAQNTFRR